MQAYAKLLCGLIIYGMFVLGNRPVQAQTNPQLFATVSIPTGVAVDTQGNIFIISGSAFQNHLIKFNPKGQVISKTELGFFAIGSLAIDPQSGLIWHLWSSGEIAVINPDTGRWNVVLNLKQLPVDVSQVYDVETGVIQDFGSLLLPGAPQTTYGDIALLRRENQLDLLLSGNSIAHPFVLRLRIVNQRIISATVLVSSLTSGAPENNLPRGVAVNAKGMALTALPREGTDLFIMDHAITFSVDFPEKPTRANLPRILFSKMAGYPEDGADFTGTGMATDTKGNFYVATGLHGTSLCKGGSGELALLAPRFTQINCSRLNRALLNSQDVAVDEDNGFVYMTVLEWGSDPTGQVIRFDLP